jgi:hypothetical protein
VAEDLRCFVERPALDVPSDEADVIKYLQADGGSWRWSATA